MKPDEEHVAVSTFSALLRLAARTSHVPLTTARPVSVGERLADGRFTILSIVGEGGMGVVYHAHDNTLHTDVALKTIRVPDVELLARLKREFRAREAVHHRNLVRIAGLHEDAGRWFITMELVRGEQLLRWIDGDEARLREAMRQIVCALDALHREGRVHRDVKPANVLVTATGRVILLDFGLAADTSDASWLDEDTVGTVSYMAPAQARGERVGPEADWYAFGTLLYEALTGHTPYHALDEDLFDAKRTGALPSVATPRGPDDLVQLCVGLLAIDPCARPDVETLRAAFAVTAIPRAEAVPFVGRDEELRQLDALLRRARTSPGRIQRIVGESGVGKSALIAAFRDRSPTGRVLFGRCRQLEAVPFKGIDGVVQALVVALKEQETPTSWPRDLALLARTFPVLLPFCGSQTPQTEGGSEPGPQLRRRTFDALRALVALVPHVTLIIDDAQWLDRDGLAALEELVARPRSIDLLILASRSATQPPRFSDELTPISLVPLSEPEAAELAISMGIDRARAQRIGAESGGHPLWLQELVHGRRAQSLEACLGERIASLSADVRVVLELVCFAAAPPSMPVLGVAGSLLRDRPSISPSVAELTDSRWLRVSDTGDRVEPYHDRIAQAVVGSAHAADARKIHEALARAFGEVSPHRSELAAHHWEQAKRPDLAHPLAVRAGESAMKALGFERAVSWFRLALATLRQPEAKAPLQLRLARALADASRPSEAADAYLAVAGATGDAKMDRAAAEQLLLAGRVDEGYALLCELLEQAGLPAPKRLRGWLFRWGVERLALDAERRGWRSIRPGAPEQIDLLYHASIALAFCCGVRAQALHARGLRLARCSHDSHLHGRALGLEACMTAFTGQLRTARSVLSRGQRLAAESGHPQSLALTHGAELVLAFTEGRWADAKKESAAGELRNRAAHGNPSDIALNMFFGILAAWHLGQIDNFRALVRKAEREAKTRDDWNLDVMLHAAPIPMLRLVDDDIVAARQAVAYAEERLWKRGAGIMHGMRLAPLFMVDLAAGTPERSVDTLMGPSMRIMRRALPNMFYPQTMLMLLATAAQAQTTDGPLARREVALRTTLLVRRVERKKLAWTSGVGLWAQAHVAQMFGRTREAQRLATLAADRLEQRGGPMLSAVARRWVASLRGDRDRVAVVDSVLERMGIANPERFSRSLGATSPRS